MNGHFELEKIAVEALLVRSRSRKVHHKPLPRYPSELFAFIASDYHFPRLHNHTASLVGRWLLSRTFYWSSVLLARMFSPLIAFLFEKCKNVPKSTDLRTQWRALIQFRSEIGLLWNSQVERNLSENSQLN